MKYYYLATALPTISLKAKPDISFEELKFMLQINLRGKDYQKVKLFKKFIDITNLRLLWLNKEIDPRGNLNSAELEDAILIKDFFDDYVFDFLDRYEKTEDRLKYFSFLIASYFNDVKDSQKGFLKFYFNFERKLRLISTALRAKKLNKDILKELQFEDPADEFVAYILAQKDQDSFEPPHEFRRVKKIYKKYLQDPRTLHLKLLEYKFNQIEIFSEQKPFSVEQILSYAALLILVEDYYKLNEDIGREKIKNL